MEPSAPVSKPDQRPQTVQPAAIPGLITLYEETGAETRRYRDYEWQISVLAVSLLAGLSLFAGSKDLEWVWGPTRFWFLAFSLVVVVASIGHLLYAHRRLTEARVRHSHYENLLRKSLDIEQPKTEWDKIKTVYTKGWLHLLSWALLIVSAATLPWLSTPASNGLTTAFFTNLKADVVRAVDQAISGLRARVEMTDRKLDELSAKVKGPPAQMQKRP